MASRKLIPEGTSRYVQGVEVPDGYSGVVPEGFEMIDLLEAQNVPHVELLRSTSLTRQAAGALGNVLRALADPTAARKLSVALLVWRRGDLDDPEARPLVEAAARRLRISRATLYGRLDHPARAAGD